MTKMWHHILVFGCRQEVLVSMKHMSDWKEVLQTLVGNGDGQVMKVKRYKLCDFEPKNIDGDGSI